MTQALKTSVENEFFCLIIGRLDINIMYASLEFGNDIAIFRSETTVVIVPLC